ncbi:MAG TPA: NADH-quinone oxidoreductase subunit L, partial [bacterium]|nr:NADH-quinone oxidoreductase subunit L [bacterium]
MNTLYPVLFLPLVTAVINRLFGAGMGKKASAALAIASVATAFGFAVASFLGLAALVQHGFGGALAPAGDPAVDLTNDNIA